jgi:hypothetical protein
MLLRFYEYNSTITNKILEGLWDFKIGGQSIRKVKYAGDLTLLVKEELVL